MLIRQQIGPALFVLHGSLTARMPANSKSAALATDAFGICFDVDGVIAHGTVVIPAAVEAIRRLTVEDEEIHEETSSSHQQRRRRFRLPVNFVTNSLNRPADRVRLLSDLLGVQVKTNVDRRRTEQRSLSCGLMCLLVVESTVACRKIFCSLIYVMFD